MLGVTVPETSATTIRRLTIQELTAGAERIVIGQEVDSRAVWVGRMLVTRVTVAVRETLKGQPDSTATVDIPGGVDLNRKIPIGMSVAGAPSIHADEHVVLFLARPEALTGPHRIVGLSQGKFSIIADSLGRSMVAVGANRRPLADFKAEISRHLAKP
jgi:hypothetical protein